MLVDIVHRDGSVRQVTMPGSTLQYRHFDDANKAVVVLWAIRHVAGPTRMVMLAFVMDVRFCTTDLGVEMGSVRCPDVLDASLVGASGVLMDRCRLPVRPDDRVVPRCLRVPGWSRTMVGMMYVVAKVHPAWSDILHKAQALGVVPHRYVAAIDRQSRRRADTRD